MFHSEVKKLTILAINIKSLHHIVTKTTLTLLFAAIFLLTSDVLFSSAFAEDPDLPLYRITIPMEPNENVTVVTAGGITYVAGQVAALPQTTRWPSYTASAWGGPGEVCASAVNAIHMLVSVEKEKGRTLSIIPRETIAPAAGPGASIVITSQAGTGIFGAWAPPVGSKVTILNKENGKTASLSPNDLPSRGDIVTITVFEKDFGYMAEIENRPGGRVTEWNKDGFRVIGRVIRPLGGTGRFEGTLFQKTGGLRANHCGVIDFSSSKIGKIGGFQIIPWDHALSSKEMQGSWDMTQWMIIAPPDGKSMMGATAPLFKEVLVPGPAERESLWDIWSTYGRRSLLLVRKDGGAWQRLSDIEGRNDSALRDITHLRIYFPFTAEPAKEHTSGGSR